MLYPTVDTVWMVLLLALWLDPALARPATDQDVIDTLKDVNLEELVKGVQSALQDIIKAQSRSLQDPAHAQADLSLEELLMPRARSAAQPRTLDVLLRFIRYFERIFIKILGI